MDFHGLHKKLERQDIKTKNTENFFGPQNNFIIEFIVHNLHNLNQIALKMRFLLKNTEKIEKFSIL